MKTFTNILRSKHHLLIKIGLTAVSLCICFIAAELAVRTIIPLDKGKSYEFRIPHPTLGWVLEPNAAYHNALPEERIYIKYNSRGFHDIEHSIDKPDGVLRILILGDSFMEAYSVKLEDSFARRLEELSRKAGLNVEVINLGTGGYSTLQEYLIFELLGKKYQPDVVLLGFYVENDITDNSLEISSISEKEKKRPFLDPGYPDSWEITPVDYQGSLQRYTEARKHLDSLAYRTMSRSILLKLLYKEIRRTGLRFYNDEDDGPVQVNEDLRELVSQGVYYCVEPPQYARAWDITERILRQLKAEVEFVNSKLVVFTVPSYRETGQDAEGTASQLCVEKAQGYKRLDMILKKQGIESIDLLPDFRKAARVDGIELFRKSDRHWNPLGHSLAARKVLTSLTDKGLLDVNE